MSAVSSQPNDALDIEAVNENRRSCHASGFGTIGSKQKTVVVDSGVGAQAADDAQGLHGGNGMKAAPGRCRISGPDSMSDNRYYVKYGSAPRSTLGLDSGYPN